MTFGSIFAKKGHCIHIVWCVFVGLGPRDPQVEPHMWPQQTWGQRSCWGQWPLVATYFYVFLNLIFIMIAKVCDRESRRDSWFENCLVWNCVLTECPNLWKCEPYTRIHLIGVLECPWVCYRWEKNTLTLVKWQVVRENPTAGVLLHWVIISRRWEQNHKHNRERLINTDSPRKKKKKKKKGVAVQWPNHEIPGPQNTQNWHILPEHLLVHTLIICVYSHYCIWSFCHHFPCKNDVLITSTRVEFSNPENTAVAYSCLHKRSIYC